MGTISLLKWSNDVLCFLQLHPQLYFGFQTQHYITVPNGLSLRCMKIEKWYKQSTMSARTLLNMDKSKLGLKWVFGELLSISAGLCLVLLSWKLSTVIDTYCSFRCQLKKCNRVWGYNIINSFNLIICCWRPPTSIVVLLLTMNCNAWWVQYYKKLPYFAGW